MDEDRGTYSTTASPDSTATDVDGAGNVTRLMRHFTPVQNAYFDLLFGRVSPTAHYCLMYLVRNTTGYHRPSVRLSFKAIGDALGLTRNTVMRALGELESLHIVACGEGVRRRTQVRAYSLTPAECWTLPTMRARATTSANNELVATSAENELVPTSANIGLDVSKIALVAPQTSAKIDDAINTQRNTDHKYISRPTPDGADTTRGTSSSQKTPTKPETKTLPVESEAVRLAACLRDAILAHSPNARDARAALAPAKLQGWARPIDLMLRLDGRTPDGIRAVIDFATADDFWQPNILSPGTLRKQYDRLEGQMRRQRTRATARAAPAQREPPPMPLSRGVPINAKPARLPGDDEPA